MGFIDSLGGGSGNSVKFEEVGDSIVGTVLDFKPEVDTTDFDGNPIKVPVIELRRSDTEEGEDVDLWCQKKALQSAIKAAIKAAGAEDLERGGTLAITRIEDGVAKKAGYNAPHLYEAAYQSPAKQTTAQAQGRSAADLLGG